MGAKVKSDSAFDLEHSLMHHAAVIYTDVGEDIVLSIYQVFIEDTS